MDLPVEQTGMSVPRVINLAQVVKKIEKIVENLVKLGIRAVEIAIAPNKLL